MGGAQSSSSQSLAIVVFSKVEELPRDAAAMSLFCWLSSGLALQLSGGVGQPGPLAPSMALVLQEALPWHGLLGQGC